MLINGIPIKLEGEKFDKHIIDSEDYAVLLRVVKELYVNALATSPFRENAKIKLIVTPRTLQKGSVEFLPQLQLIIEGAAQLGNSDTLEGLNNLVEFSSKIIIAPIIFCSGLILNHLNNKKRVSAKINIDALIQESLPIDHALNAEQLGLIKEEVKSALERNSNPLKGSLRADKEILSLMEIMGEDKQAKVRLGFKKSNNTILTSSDKKYFDSEVSVKKSKVWEQKMLTVSDLAIKPNHLSTFEKEDGEVVKMSFLNNIDANEFMNFFKKNNFDYGYFVVADYEYNPKTRRHKIVKVHLTQNGSVVRDTLDSFRRGARADLQ